MPYSSNLLDNDIIKIIKKLNPKVVYDIGAGAGKYGSMVRDHIGKVVKTVAIEIDPEYIKRFELKKIYTKILCISAADLINSSFYDNDFGLVIIGDCIEHLKKSEGIDLLNFLIYRSSWIMIQYPIKYLQNTFDGKSQEAHISVWGNVDFASFDIVKKVTIGNQELVLIKGYLI